MAGRHRRPPAWRRAFSTSLRRLVRSRDDVRAAALEAEVVALRATVAGLRADLDSALTRSAELSAHLEQARADAAAAEAAAAAAAAAVEPEVEAAPPVVSLQLPLVRMALAREAEPALTRDMALALTTPDRGEDTARTEIVLRDLPEHPLLDPKADRDREPVDHAAAAAAPEESTRRIA
ncbi:MAG TPA: hypothetical protein VFV76_16760 [Actinomycetes bacterium]|nr:hypothetical protein [Actinomycetes bacterium]